MYKSYFLIGVTIAVMAGLLVPVLPLQTKASTCTSSASTTAPNRAFFATQSSAAAAKRVAPTRDIGCASSGVAVANQGAFCSAVNNGQNARISPNIQTFGSSCSASNQFGSNQLDGGLESATK